MFCLPKSVFSKKGVVYWTINGISSTCWLISSLLVSPGGHHRPHHSYRTTLDTAYSLLTHAILYYWVSFSLLDSSCFFFHNKHTQWTNIDLNPLTVKPTENGLNQQLLNNPSGKSVVLESSVKPSLTCYLCSAGLVWKKIQEPLTQDAKLCSMVGVKTVCGEFILRQTRNHFELFSLLALIHRYILYIGWVYLSMIVN